jgi:hypothetical protein
MKIYTIIIAAMFGLLMMAMPKVASAEIFIRHVRPVVQQVVAPAPFTPIEYYRPYYRPWACANRHYRRHHWWRCH